ATLRMNGEWLDDASATVPVITPELKIEITQISQVDPGTQRRVTGLFQTGEPIEIEFIVSNEGSEPIPLVFVTGNVAFPASGPAQVNCTAVGTLEPGAQKTESCYFVPETEIDPADLNPELTLTASGGLPGDDPITHEAEATLSLVDLVLGATLEVAPPAAERGEDVTLTLTLTNLGASPLGCDIAIRDARP